MIVELNSIYKALLNVDATLSFASTAPATSAFIFTFCYWRCNRFITDAGVTLVV
jgi:hypothetical protein